MKRPLTSINHFKRVLHKEIIEAVHIETTGRIPSRSIVSTAPVIRQLLPITMLDQRRIEKHISLRGDTRWR